MAFSSSRAICHQRPGEMSASFSAVISPRPRPLGPETATLPINTSRRRPEMLRFRIENSSSRSLPSRSISSRSMAMARSSLSTPCRLKTRTSTTVPVTPGGRRSEVSRTSEAFSPKMARRSFSSGVIGLSPFGVTLPTRISPGMISAPMATMPASSMLRSASSPTLGMSRVISSGPSLVSRAITSNSSMWIEVKTSSETMRSLIRIESSKL